MWDCVLTTVFSIYSKARIAQGFRTIKMNATEDVNWLDSAKVLESSVERIRIVKSLGLEAALDFHGRLHKPMAKQLAQAVEPYKPFFIEEPLLSEHPEAIKNFYSHTTTPIALGERLYNRWDIKPFLQDSSVDILQPDVSHVGGISELKKMANMAEAYDVAIAPHCPLGPIALAASFQVAMNIPNFVIQEMSLGIHYNTEAGEHDIHTYVTNPEAFDVKDGHVVGPAGVGLGIEIDEEAVRRLSKGCIPWLPKEFHGTDGSIREW
jgi:galactonate dehydratase